MISGSFGHWNMNMYCTKKVGWFHDNITDSHWNKPYIFTHKHTHIIHNVIHIHVHAHQCTISSPYQCACRKMGGYSQFLTCNTENKAWPGQGYIIVHVRLYTHTYTHTYTLTSPKLMHTHTQIHVYCIHTHLSIHLHIHVSNRLTADMRHCLKCCEAYLVKTLNRRRE